MLRYIIRTLWHYKFQMLSLLVGLLAVQLGVCTGLLALHQTRVSVTGDISQYSRDLYDILVLPPLAGSNLAGDNGLELLEPNYLSKSTGGISRESWREIKSLPGVDIAAPVAALGYFTNTIDSLQIIHPAAKAARYQIKFSTGDGYQDYALNECILACVTMPDSPFPVLAKADMSEDRIVFSCGGGANGEARLQFMLPPIYNYLVAVDPESEARLSGLEDALQRGKFLSEGPLTIENEYIEGPVDAYQIPVLINAAIPVPLKVTIVQEDLKTTPHLEQLFSQLGALYLEGKQGTIQGAREISEVQGEINELLLSAGSITSAETELDLSRYLKAFQTTGIIFDSAGGTCTTTSLGLQHTAPATRYYNTHGIAYHTLGEGVFQPIPTGVKDGQVTYHRLEAQGKEPLLQAKDGWIFQLVPVGEVDFSGPGQNELAKSPLGIYGPEHMILEEDGAGNRLASPAELRPTVTAGTLQLPAAHGFTTLEAALFLKGEAPIDAVRVRVAGVERYDAAGATRIRQVAAEIADRTDLRVLIVAGASPEPVTLNLPGHEDIAPLGLAQTWWIRLGAATVIGQTFSIFTSALVLAFIIVGLVFVHNRSRIHLWQRREEVAILHAEGWPRKAIIKLFVVEVALLWLLAAVITLSGGALLCGLLNSFWATFSLRWTFVLFIGGALFCGGVYFTLNRFSGPVIDHDNNAAGRVKTGFKNILLPLRRKGIAAVVGADFSYYGIRLRAMVLQLLLGGSLGFFAWMAGSAAGKHVTPTRLGEFIFARAGSWLTIIGLATAALLILTCLDSLLSYMDLRRPELLLLLQLGWKPEHLYKLILPQLLIPVTLAVIIAAALAGGGVFLLYRSFPIPIWQLLVAAAAFTGSTLLPVCGWMLTLQETSGGKRARCPAGWITGIAVALLIGAAALSIWSRPGVEQSGPAADADIEAQVLITELGSEALELTQQLAALGHRPAGSEVNRQEVELLYNWLQQAGLEAVREPVTVPPYRSLGAGSELTVNGIPVKFTALAADLSGATVLEPFLLQDPDPIFLAAGALPERPIRGRLLLLEAASPDDFRKSLSRYLDMAPAAIVGVNPGAISAAGPAALRLEIVEIIKGYDSETVRVDLSGEKEAGEPVWVITNHGAAGPGASDNASGAAGAALLARRLKNNPLPVPVRIVWTAGGEAQYCGGLALFLDQEMLAGPVIAVCRLGSKQAAILGYREDTRFGRPRDWPAEASDLEPGDYIESTGPPPQHKSQLWDLSYPGVSRWIKSETWSETMITPDHWMAAAEKADRELKIGVLPGIPTVIGSRLLEAGIPAAFYQRFAPYSNTKKDTLERIDPEILGRDILFIERVLREVTGEGVNND
jgi:putative ABC transport system permease protein